MPIKVFSIDDSAPRRQQLAGIIQGEADMTHVGAAGDVLAAVRLLATLKPEVVILVVATPPPPERLQQLLQASSAQVLVLSAHAPASAPSGSASIARGQLHQLQSPRLAEAGGVAQMSAQIVSKIRLAATQAPRRVTPSPALAEKALPRALTSDERVLLVGASTGGTEAVKDLLQSLPVNCPPVLIVQHMPAGFAASFVKRLDALCRLNVCEAAHGQRILPGHAYVAPGGRHMKVRRVAGAYVLELFDELSANLHCPSVDVLFQSAASAVAANAVALLLTGMGKDGAQGLLALRKAGAHTVAQSEASCVVFGMPREAIQLGAVDAVLDLDKMGVYVMQRFACMSPRPSGANPLA